MLLYINRNTGKWIWAFFPSCCTHCVDIIWLITPKWAIEIEINTVLSWVQTYLWFSALETLINNYSWGIPCATHHSMVPKISRNTIRIMRMSQCTLYATRSTLESQRISHVSLRYGIQLFPRDTASTLLWKTLISYLMLCDRHYFAEFDPDPRYGVQWGHQHLISSRYSKSNSKKKIRSRYVSAAVSIDLYNNHSSPQQSKKTKNWVPFSLQPTGQTISIKSHSNPSNPAWSGLSKQTRRCDRVSRNE
jgi:hypothetical protein